jgi:hypothetical protein
VIGAAVAAHDLDGVQQPLRSIPAAAAAALLPHVLIDHLALLLETGISEGELP